jgi:uncharacterized protein DUF2628
MLWVVMEAGGSRARVFVRDSAHPPCGVLKPFHVPGESSALSRSSIFKQDSGRDMGATIYLQHPGQKDAVAVATGFSWGACLLGFIWAMSKKMWFASFVMLAINLILFAMGLWGETADLIGLVLSAAFGFACGAYGNQWHRWTLEKRGYVLL